MTRVTPEIREQILKDKATLPTKALQEKYNLSRSSVQRIKLPDLEARAKAFIPQASPPTPLDDTAGAAFVESLFRDMAPPPAPPPPPPPPPPPKEPIIQRILLNADTFPAHFPFITDRTAFQASLHSMNAYELDSLLQTMERTRSTNNLSAQIKGGFFMGARAIEALGSRIRLKTQGFTDALQQQQQELD
jgi:hypothetical protein